MLFLPCFESRGPKALGAVTMKDFHLRFFAKRRWSDWEDDLMTIDGSEIPETAGAYVLGTRDGTQLIYPWGTSPIYYIGKANNLKQRLLEHRQHINGAEADHQKVEWWPRYQFGAAFGADMAWYSVRGRQDPYKLEADLVEKFYWFYGSIPLANGAWPSGLRKPTHGSRDD